MELSKKKLIAHELVKARKSGVQTNIPWPDAAPSLSDAMEIQNIAIDEFASPCIGWKVGATAKAAQEFLKLDDAFYGPITKAGFLASDAEIQKTPCIGACEPEYAFKMADDFPLAGEEATKAKLMEAIDKVHIVIEIIGRRIANPEYANGLGVAMDFAGHSAFIIGPQVDNWQNQDLANTVVESLVDDKIVETGCGLAVMGDPINSLLWLAKQLVLANKQLKAGEWVSTGTCTAAVPAEAGTTYTAIFGGFGQVSVNFQ